MANTRHNNPKAFNRNLSKKDIKPTRNEEATLGYYSASNDEYTDQKSMVFFWGYRLHLIVDAETDNPLTYVLTENNRKDFDVAVPLYCSLAKYYPSLYMSGISQVADKGYHAEKVFKAFNLLFDGTSAIPTNLRNTQSQPVVVPYCEAELKMSYQGSWYEEKQDRFRVKFVCPDKSKSCEFRKTKYGCTKYFQVKESYPGQVQPFTDKFAKLYSYRQSVERVNAFLQTVGLERPKCFSIRSIENLIGFALLGKALQNRIKKKQKVFNKAA
jgi:hypothetical protein